jgi:putative transposase
MAEWPHSPVHRLDAAGTYMVTAATYGKVSIFGSRAKLGLLQQELFEVSQKHEAALQAWSIFPNHYHFIAQFRQPNTLKLLIRELHSRTARSVNEVDCVPGRKVWFQYWDSRIAEQRSFFARLHYVHRNAVHHGVTRVATNYPWCSAAWFVRHTTPAFRKTILAFPIDKLRTRDNFDVPPLGSLLP